MACHANGNILGPSLIAAQNSPSGKQGPSKNTLAVGKTHVSEHLYPLIFLGGSNIIRER
jgi:hypothetical protein